MEFAVLVAVADVAVTTASHDDGNLIGNVSIDGVGPFCCTHEIHTREELLIVRIAEIPIQGADDV